jgi:hypothetical protein
MKVYNAIFFKTSTALSPPRDGRVKRYRFLLMILNAVYDEPCIEIPWSQNFLINKASLKDYAAVESA